MRAKYYIYWNLHKDCYSVRYKGRVIGHYKNLTAEGVQFKVSQKGRDRVLKEQRKNVHAFVVADTIYPDTLILRGEISSVERVTYNPYLDPSFMVRKDYMLWPIYQADTVLLTSKERDGRMRADVKICKQ